MAGFREVTREIRTDLWHPKERASSAAHSGAPDLSTEQNFRELIR